MQIFQCCKNPAVKSPFVRSKVGEEREQEQKEYLAQIHAERLSKKGRAVRVEPQEGNAASMSQTATMSIACSGIVQSAFSNRCQRAHVLIVACCCADVELHQALS